MLIQDRSAQSRLIAAEESVDKTLYVKLAVETVLQMSRVQMENVLMRAPQTQTLAQIVLLGHLVDGVKT